MAILGFLNLAPLAGSVRPLVIHLGFDFATFLFITILFILKT
jgi:hypothetical protein